MEEEALGGVRRNIVVLKLRFLCINTEYLWHRDESPEKYLHLSVAHGEVLSMPLQFGERALQRKTLRHQCTLHPFHTEGHLCPIKLHQEKLPQTERGTAVCPPAKKPYKRRRQVLRVRETRAKRSRSSLTL